MEIIYKHNYGTEDLLGAQIKICKHKTTNKYMIYAQFYAFDESVLPTIKTTYDVIFHKTKINTNEMNIIVKTCDITLLAPNNPPPENLFMIE